MTRDPLRLFAAGYYYRGCRPIQTYTQNAEDRVRIVRASVDMAALEDAKDLVQPTVRAAIINRLKKLNKPEKSS
ncbi:MAG: hypothetical protein QG638_73 [Pseudomonadota bacterium]|nr:hypothetical protein [Pseudomonadota bacterium]